VPRPILSAVLVLAGAILLVGSWPSGEALAPESPQPPAETPSLGVTPPTYAPSPEAPGSAIRPIPPGYRVSVPRLGIDLPVAEGDLARDVQAQATPEGFAFHLPGSALPGERGNTYLYAHARSGMFLALWDARVGDTVIVASPDGATLRYVITEVRPRVPSSEVSVAAATDDERLTLQTSTGPNADDPRFVVIAHRD